MPKHRLWILALLALPLAGCANPRPFGLEMPRLFGPGPLDYQRHSAVLHDPYPDPDVAPQVDGGRPREYQRPPPEPVRNRWLTDSFWQR
jgi:hypothetical protein